MKQKVRRTALHNSQSIFDIPVLTIAEGPGSRGEVGIQWPGFPATLLLGRTSGPEKEPVLQGGMHLSGFLQDVARVACLGCLSEQENQVLLK